MSNRLEDIDFDSLYGFEGQFLTKIRNQINKSLFSKKDENEEKYRNKLEAILKSFEEQLKNLSQEFEKDLISQRKADLDRIRIQFIQELIKNSSDLRKQFIPDQTIPQITLEIQHFDNLVSSYDVAYNPDEELGYLMDLKIFKPDEDEKKLLMQITICIEYDYGYTWTDDVGQIYFNEEMLKNTHCSMIIRYDQSNLADLKNQQNLIRFCQWIVDTLSDLKVITKCDEIESDHIFDISSGNLFINPK